MRCYSRSLMRCQSGSPVGRACSRRRRIRRSLAARAARDFSCNETLTQGMGATSHQETLSDACVCELSEGGHRCCGIAKCATWECIYHTSDCRPIAVHELVQRGRVCAPRRNLRCVGHDSPSNNGPLRFSSRLLADRAAPRSE